jgi:predicted nucleic acid-binding protein
MSAEYFMDTNVFIYAFSPHEPVKKARAASLIRIALSDCAGVISSQVVQEFINVAVHKPTASVPPAILLDYIDHVLHPLCQVMPSPSLYLKAIHLHRETQYPLFGRFAERSQLRGAEDREPVRVRTWRRMASGA